MLSTVAETTCKRRVQSLQILHTWIGRSRMRPPPRPNFSFSCSFWGKLAKIIGWCPTFAVGAPPLGNPGSATDLVCISCTTNWIFVHICPFSVCSFLTRNRVTGVLPAHALAYTHAHAQCHARTYRTYKHVFLCTVEQPCSSYVTFHEDPRYFHPMSPDL